MAISDKPEQEKISIGRAIKVLMPLYKGDIQIS